MREESGLEQYLKGCKIANTTYKIVYSLKSAVNVKSVHIS